MAALPAEFADLEPFSEWCLATERARYAKRLSSSMAEMQAFYDAALPRLEEAMSYLERFELTGLGEEASSLLWLCYSLISVSFPVEVWRQARVPDSGAAAVDLVGEPVP